MVREPGIQPPTIEAIHGPNQDVLETVGNVALTASDVQPHDTVVSPVNIFPAAAMAAHAEKQKDIAAVQAEHLEAIKLLDKDDFKLGNLNPLTKAVDLAKKESVDAVRYTILNKIEENDGMMPRILESTVVFEPVSGEAGLRFIARFEVPELSEEQIVMLEEIVEQTYGLTVRTRTDSKGNENDPENYPPIQMGEEWKSKTGGWYMGPNLTPTTSLHEGLYVFQNLGQITAKNFTKREERSGSYIVEIRESSQYQTDLVTLVTQVAAVLGNNEIPDRGQLLYETYYDLIRLALKHDGDQAVYGMEGAMDLIRRELILPLASPEISKGVGEEAQSVLLVGVPGTGKTLLVEQLLQDETNIFILPIDPFELMSELSKPKEKQRLMPRIAEVARITGRYVVLHVDDIENTLGEHSSTNSTILNLMSGVQESGFKVIASTNYPDKINPSLIQPQRFSVLIHCGLQDEDARFEILKLHADLVSKKQEKPLFSSVEVRDMILREIAIRTEAFTPRYLGDIATVAKSHLINRISNEKNQLIGLTEEDLDGYTFSAEDWALACVEVADKYDSAEVKLRDEVLAQFVKKNTKRLVGFGPATVLERSFFTPNFFEDVMAAENRLTQEAAQNSGDSL